MAQEKRGAINFTHGMLRVMFFSIEGGGKKGKEGPGRTFLEGGGKVEGI